MKSTGITISYNTSIDYLRHLEDAYLIFSISNYSDKLSEKERIKKRYFYDNGFLNNVLFNPETKLLDNLVAITLKQRYGDDVFYYNRNVEVDFFMPNAKIAIQASYSLTAEDTLTREVRALAKLATEYSIADLTIVTWSEERTITDNNATIKVVPLWKWLLK